MLSRDYKTFFVIFSFSLIFLFSCKKNNEKSDNTILYKDFSIKSTTEVEYKNVYQQINDTVINWIRSGITYYGVFEFNKTLRIDSLLCFNNNKTKLISAKLTRHDDGHANSDGITFFYGVKIKEKWYFFDGAYIVLPREYYQKDTHTPLSFARLHEIAMKEVFNGYLIEKKTKKDLGWWKNIFSPEYEYKYEINDRFFNELNIPLVAFSERKTNPNCPFSCRVIDNEKEYAECLLKKQALSIWNEECAFIKNDTYLYAPELPIGEKVISKINKGESFKVLEYIDNTEWVYVRMSAHNPNLGLIHRKEISKSKP